MTPSDILREAQNNNSQIIADRRYLHSHPETSFDLKTTVEYVKKTLTDMGYCPTACGRSGLSVLAGGKKPGKVFLLRADMDALPIQEESDVDFAAENGKMHACGHDMHTAMLLGAARILKKYEDEIEGTVKLMFQPAEEILEGSKDMINAGILKNPDVDAALMIHVMAGMPFPSGTAIVCDGGVSAPAADYFTIEVKGMGCHGSMPNTGVDPITAAAHIITATQAINARELSLTDEATLTFGLIHAGDAGNVIPDSVILKGTLRAFDDTVHTFIKKRLTEIATGIATSLRANATVTFGSGCPTLVNDTDLSSCTIKYIQELNGPNGAFTAGQLNVMSAKNGKNPPKTSGSEDFAYISHNVPSIMLALAAGHPDEGYIYPQHHPKVKYDEATLPLGSAIYAYTAMRWLEEHK